MSEPPFGKARRYDPPQPIEVRIGDGHPWAVKRRAWVECVHLDGPLHRTRDRHHEVCDRTYYLVQLGETEMIAEIYQDEETGGWFIERMW